MDALKTADNDASSQKYRKFTKAKESVVAIDSKYHALMFRWLMAQQYNKFKPFECQEPTKRRVAHFAGVVLAEMGLDLRAPRPVGLENDKTWSKAIKDCGVLDNAQRRSMMVAVTKIAKCNSRAIAPLISNMVVMDRQARSNRGGWKPGGK